jgi:hypothetical protein
VSNSADTAGAQRVQVIELFRMIQVEHFRHFAVDSFIIYLMAGLREGLGRGGGGGGGGGSCEGRAMSVAMHHYNPLLRKSGRRSALAEPKSG